MDQHPWSTLQPHLIRIPAIALLAERGFCVPSTDASAAILRIAERKEVLG